MNRVPITIITPPHTLYLAHLVQGTLVTLGLDSEVCVGEFPGVFSERNFVVICPQVFSRLPESFLAFQMEQAGTHWFGERYVGLLRSPLVTILDYSERNIPYLVSRGVDPSRIRHAQLTFFPGYHDFLERQGCSCHSLAKKEYDLLFYGGINERRFRILSALDRQFRIKVAVGVFGEPLYRLISASRIVLNIHIQDDSPLESTRVLESVSLGADVVSESSPDASDYTDLASVVSFVAPGDQALLASTLSDRLKMSQGPHLQVANPSFGCTLAWGVDRMGWR